MLYGSFSNDGVPKGLFLGSTISMALATVVVAFLNIKTAFEDGGGKWGAISLVFYPIGFIVFVFQNWKDRQAEFYKLILAAVPFNILLIAGLVQGLFQTGSGTTASQSAPPPVNPQMMMPGQMQQPGQMPQPGQMMPQGGPAAPGTQPPNP
jgi:hypothetical protein